MADADFPLYGYVYDAHGRYRGPREIRDEEALNSFRTAHLLPAMSEHREVRITDRFDCLVFHAQDGHIVYLGSDDLSRPAAG